MGLESSQGGRSMMSLKVSIFFRSSIRNMTFPLHPLELSGIMPATFFRFLDTSELVACMNQPFFVKNDNLRRSIYISTACCLTLTNLFHILKIKIPYFLVT